MDHQQNHMLSVFKDKRIIIVGPAACLSEDCKNIDIDSFDVVCRLNTHHRMRFNNPIVGKRLDVLFHALEKFQYDKKEVEYWENNNFSLISRVHHPIRYNIIKKLGYTKKIYHIPTPILVNCRKILECNPNTGVMSIYHALHYEASEVHAIGFDFYQTLYLTKKDEKFRKEVLDNKIGNHDPKKQLKLFKKAIKEVPNFYPHGKLKELLK